MEQREYDVYLVTTPIGNLKDISLRALEVLKTVDLIYCEDTTHSRILLKNYEIDKKTLSLHKFNTSEVLPKLIENVKSGKKIAYITDAGVPSISDPGQEIVKKLIENNITYTLVGCPCALINALVLSGMDTNCFTFIGFLDENNKKRLKQVESIKYSNSTLIFYSAVHNLKEDIKYLYIKLRDRKIAIIREITKLYEEIIHTSLKEFESVELKGEFVIVVEGFKSDENLDPENELGILLNLGYDAKDAIKQVAKQCNLPKNDVYQMYLKINKNKGK